MSDVYATLLERIRRIGRLESMNALLEWDQHTYMPAKGVTGRAELCALIAELKHQWLTSDELGALLEKAVDNGDWAQATNIRETKRSFARASRVPEELVTRMARTAAIAQNAWIKARADNHFETFAPHLREIIELKRLEAEAIGYEGEPYDALVDEFEPGATAAMVEKLFGELRQRLVPIVSAIAQAKQRPDFELLKRYYPRAGQEQLGRRIAKEMNFDFDAGRMDESVHPFCMSMNPDDVRLTTRYNEHYMPSAVFGVMHETGHSLYEQGLLKEHMFTPAGTAVSLGIHESQSLLWENQVGRSQAFWRRHFSMAQELFAAALGGIAQEDFYAAINTVQPSFIRVDADEVTYGLHIILRFELERDILNKKLEVDGIPDAWNAKMKDLLGITPPTNREGCLQDIHWSIGAIGYFPTYAMGSLYAAQFMVAARTAMPDLDERIEQGDLGLLLGWLRENIHRHGKRYRPGELCELVTGKPLSVDAFIAYVQRKFKPIYGLD